MGEIPGHARMAEEFVSSDVYGPLLCDLLIRPSFSGIPSYLDSSHHVQLTTPGFDHMDHQSSHWYTDRMPKIP